MGVRAQKKKNPVSTIRVMLVDDHHLVRTGIKRMLADESGIEVVAEVSSGEEAIATFGESPVDVVLMDVKMPGMGGFEATKKLIKLDPKVKVLVLTVFTNDLYPAKLLQLGAAGYLTKGDSPEEMVQAVHAVCSGERYMSAEISRLIALRHVSEENSLFASLSERELQVVLFIINGERVKDIAEKLFLSEKTVNTYRYRVFEKLNVQNDVELTLLAMKKGLLDSET